MKELAEQIASWLKDYAVNAGAEGYVVGLSGGVDSATAAALAVKGLGKENVFGVMMPCHSDPMDQTFARMVTDWLDIDYFTITLDLPFTTLASTMPIALWGKDRKVIEGNMKARMRMTTLYTVARGFNYLVLGTGNKTECLLGYFTKYGDGGVDVLPLGDLYKTEVWELARELGVPQQIIDRPPTAGLWEGQTDEEEIGATYKQMDTWLQGEQMDVEWAVRFTLLESAAKHKLEMPPIFRRFPTETEN